MKWFAGTLPLLALLLFGRPAVAQDEATIKGAFIMCGLQHVLIACDDLVKMPDLNNVVRSNAYGARAGVLVGLGRMDDAKRDLDTALKLDPGNTQVALFKTMLLGGGLDGAACEAVRRPGSTPEGLRCGA